MLPASLASRYRFRRVLGRGGFGAVAEAEDQETGRLVAIKTLSTLDPEGRERFEREARTLAAVRHPGVVEVLDFGVADEAPYLIMELVEGGAISAPPWPEPEVLGCAEAVAQALDELHAQGVVHRDVKPDNVVRRLDGSFVLVDFGLARATSRGSTVTQEGMLLGTPAFMAPELWRQEAATAASDQFALAALVCHLVAGVGPLEDGPPMEVCRAALAGRAGVPAGVPEAWVPALTRALRLDPTARFDTCGALVAELRAGRPGALAVTRRVPAAVPTPPPAPPSGRPWLVPVLVGGLSLGALGVLAPGDPPAPEAPAPPSSVAEEAPRASGDPAERAEAAQRIAAARQRLDAALDGPLHLMGGRVFRRNLERDRAMLPPFRDLITAQAAWIRATPHGPEPIPEFGTSYGMLKGGLDTHQMLVGELAAFSLTAEERRVLPDRVQDLRSFGEGALAGLLGRDLAPGRRLEVAGLLLLAGYSDPPALFEYGRAAAAARPVTLAQADALVKFCAVLGEAATSPEHPCPRRRRFLKWALEALADPDNLARFRAHRTWGNALVRLASAGVVVAGEADCAGVAPDLGPPLGVALQQFLARRRDATGEAADELTFFDAHFADVAQAMSIPAEVAGPLGELNRALGPDFAPQRHSPRWKRILDPEASEP